MKLRIHQRVLRETPLPGGQRLDLEIRDGAEPVPAALLLPESASPEHPVPAALLLHGYSADKEMMAGTIGRALVQRGIASLALDLPLHGGRSAEVRRRRGAPWIWCGTGARRWRRARWASRTWARAPASTGRAWPLWATPSAPS